MPSLCALIPDTSKERSMYMDEIMVSLRLPFLALRGLNVFPGLTVHFDVGRKKSIKAVE